MSEVQEKNLNPAGNKRAQALPLVPFNYDDEEDLTPEQRQELFGAYEESMRSIGEGEIVRGTVLSIDEKDVLVDVGFKSEGIISLSEFPDPSSIKVGDVLEVFLEKMENQDGLVVLSKQRADFVRVWDRVKEAHDSGQVVEGKLIRKIKGGVVVDLYGVEAFLPGSQIALRQVQNVDALLGQSVAVKIIKLNKRRRNIVVSRRAVLEEERDRMKATILKDLAKDQIREGVVKNITDFGAFVDLGGIDGLLHITDMSWERIGHPTEMVAIDQEIEVKILQIDREKQKIALGLKQKQNNPWTNIAEKYPVGSTVPGEVVNVMSYGAFVKLEPGIEGLVHISEMSWTRRINHPSEMVQIGDKIDVKILGVDPQGQQLSLGIKQTQSNPWDDIMQRYPENAEVTGKVRNLTNYGAFIELEEGIDGLLHVSDMSWTRKISHPSEVLQKGQQVKCRVLSVDQARRRIALGMKQLDDDPWNTTIPEKYKPGQLIRGKVTKITNFGVFVGLEDNLEGLLHISELADSKVENPEDVVKVGDEIEVKVLRVDSDERKIGLSRRRVDWTEEQHRVEAEKEQQHQQAKADKQAELKGGLGSEGPLIPQAE